MMFELTRGPLAEHTDFTLGECAQVLEQLTSAPVYLHGQNITHHDIDTTNILVRSRKNNVIDILFTDFRFTAQKTVNMKTIHAMKPYNDTEHTNADGIWSLDVVVVFGMVSELPSWKKRFANDDDTHSGARMSLIGGDARPRARPAQMAWLACLWSTCWSWNRRIDGPLRCAGNIWRLAWAP